MQTVFAKENVMLIKLQLGHKNLSRLHTALEKPENRFEKTTDPETSGFFVSIKSVKEVRDNLDVSAIPLYNVTLEVLEHYHPLGVHALYKTPMEKLSTVLQAMELFPDEDKVRL
jgi:hypothetical protein